MTVTSPTALCSLCRLKKEIIYEDDLDQGYCVNCVANAPISEKVKVFAFLLATIPFKVGDKVECRYNGTLEGVGIVDAVYLDLEHAATPVYPTFHVEIEGREKTNSPYDGLYTENCLKLVEDE